MTASDVSRHRFVRLPWDYPLYGLDPDEQEVADAVRASASIPFFFEPVTLRSPGAGRSEGSVSTLVDGSVLSNFPVAVFDRADGRPPRWPTFGVRLSMRPEGRVQTTEVRGTVSLALSLVETMLEACDAAHIDDPCVQSRSVFVDTSGVSPVDFGITDEQQEQLLLAGHEAAGAFLRDWDWPRLPAALPGRRGAERDGLAALRGLAERAGAAGRARRRRLRRHGEPPTSVGRRRGSTCCPTWRGRSRPADGAACRRWRWCRP